MKQARMLLLFPVVFAMTFAVGIKSFASDDDISKMITVDALNNLSGQYHLFEEFKSSSYPRIVLTPKFELRNFKFLELEVDDSERDRKMRIKSVLHSLDRLLPEKPFVVTWEERYEYHANTPHRGISFVDGNNTTKYFAIRENDRAGSRPAILFKFQPGVDGKFSLDDEISKIITVHDTEEDCSLAKPPEWKCPPSEILSKYRSFEVFMESKKNGSEKIVLVPKIELKNFKYIELDGDDEPWNKHRVKSVLYSLDRLLPEKPFVVTWSSPYDWPLRGIICRWK